MRNEMIKNDKVCILISDGGVLGDEVAIKHVKSLLDKIKIEDLEKVKIVRPLGEYAMNDGFCREFFAKFIYDNLFELKKIYVDDLFYCSTSEVEQKIFVALMSLFGIEVYDNYNCEIVEPDSVYRGEISKAFHLIIEMPECILEASNEKIEEIKYIAVVIMQRIWEEYRFPDKKKNS